VRGWAGVEWLGRGISYNQGSNQLQKKHPITRVASYSKIEKVSSNYGALERGHEGPNIVPNELQWTTVPRNPWST
jgi:hypothetical protein